MAIPTVYFGGLGSIGFSKETTPGTAQTTVTNFFPFEGFSARQEHKLIDIKGAVGSMGDLPSQQGTLSPLGKLSTVMTASQPHPFYWALGKVVTTGSGTYTHTVTIDPAGAMPSLTCEANQVAIAVKQAGVFLNKLTLKASAGEVGKLDMEWLGLTHTDGATLTSTPAYQNDYLTFVGATVSLSGAGVTDVSDIELSINNNFEQKYIVGSRTPAVLVRKGIPEITGKLTFIDFPTTYYNNLRDAVSFAVNLTFTNGTKTLTIACPCVQATKGFDQDIKQEAITGSIDFKVFQNPADSNIITVTSTGTSVTVLTN